MATEQSWTQRMAEELCRADTLTPEMVACILEAAGELKAARLRVLLAQCYEIIQHSEVSGEAARPDDGFMDIVLEAIA